MLFCFFFANITLAQAIKGRVFDETNKPLFGATIFLDGTSISTISNEEGFFQLPVIARINTNLVVSYIGYQSVSIASYNDATELKITLQPSINSLKEVVIKKERFTRKEMLKLFREQFLGETKAGKKAIILNENDLDFEYDENYKVFKASSDKPLIIQNPVLGYEVTYEISDFIVQFHSLSIKSEDVHKILYTGVSHFKEISNSKDVVKERMKSYRGSVLHFFRSLVSDKMVENDFMLVAFICFIVLLVINFVLWLLRFNSNRLTLTENTIEGEIKLQSISSEKLVLLFLLIWFGVDIVNYLI